MRQLLKYIKKVIRLTNKVVVWIALLLIYLVICLYHFLFHQKVQRWGYYENKVSLEQTKHLW